MRLSDWHHLCEADVLTLVGRASSGVRYRLEARDHLGRWIAAQLGPDGVPQCLVTVGQLPRRFRVERA